MGSFLATLMMGEEHVLGYMHYDRGKILMMRWGLWDICWGHLLYGTDIC